MCSDFSFALCLFTIFTLRYFTFTPFPTTFHTGRTIIMKMDNNVQIYMLKTKVVSN